MRLRRNAFGWTRSPAVQRPDHAGTAYCILDSTVARNTSFRDVEPDSQLGPIFVGRCRALLVNLPGLCLVTTLCSLAGMVVYAEYRRCDPLATHRVHAKDQVGQYYTMIMRWTRQCC